MSKINRWIKRFRSHCQEMGVGGALFVAVRYVWRKLRGDSDQKEDYWDLPVDAKVIASLTGKTDPTVYVVAGVPYYDIGGGQRCSQLAKTYNKMGFRVKYIYTIQSCDPKSQELTIPTETHVFLDEKTIAYVREQAKAGDLFIFEVPMGQMEPLLDIAVEKQCRIVYENIDNWETSLGADVFSEPMLQKLLREAHVLTGTARPLVEQLKRYLDRYRISAEGKEILYLPNAVDEELFCGVQQCQMPADLVRGERTLLYYGSLWGEWFSWELVFGLARRHPEYAINLIGNADGIRKIVGEAPKNVHFLGLKNQTELPAYLQYVDYAILPFDRGEIGDYVSPLKIFEYIAMYTRVISTSLPDIVGYPNVYLGDTVDEWERIAAGLPAVDVEAADEFTDRNTWYSRITEMLRHLYPEWENSDLKGRLSIVVLNYNNKNVIFKCVNSLLRYRELYDYEIIVVDNGSSDGSYEMLKERYSEGEVAVYRNSKNGCSSGRNLGVSRSSREYVLFLDSDQWATNRYWLKAYESVMERHPEWGAIGWFAGFFIPSGATGHLAGDFPHRYMPPQMLCRSDIGFLGSGGMMVRREDLLQMGGFDVQYDPTAYEDTDLSLQMRDNGKEIYYCPYLGVIHLPHQTTGQVLAEKSEVYRRNRDYFIAKWKERNPKLLKYIQ